MRHLKCKLAGLSLLAFFAHCVFAAPRDVGSGGNAVVCPAGSQYGSVYSLDEYEAQEFFHLQLALPQASGHFLQRVNFALARLKQFDPARAYNLGQDIATWFSGLYWNGDLATTKGELEPVPDQVSVGYVPTGCTIKQVIIQQIPPRTGRTRFLIAGPLWTELSDANKAALVLHEALVAEARRNHDGSEPWLVRQLNAWLISTAMAELTPAGYEQVLRETEFFYFPINFKGHDYVWESLRWWDPEHLQSGTFFVHQTRLQHELALDNGARAYLDDGSNVTYDFNGRMSTASLPARMVTGGPTNTFYPPFKYVLNDTCVTIMTAVDSEEHVELYADGTLKSLSATGQIPGFGPQVCYTAFGTAYKVLTAALGSNLRIDFHPTGVPREFYLRPNNTVSLPVATKMVQIGFVDLNQIPPVPSLVRLWASGILALGTINDFTTLLTNAGAEWEFNPRTKLAFDPEGRVIVGP